MRSKKAFILTPLIRLEIKYPNIPISKKPIEVRMGKGKGSPEFWACRVKPGRILFEVDGVPENIAREALYKASAKLPIKCKFIKRI